MANGRLFARAVAEAVGMGVVYLIDAQGTVTVVGQDAYCKMSLGELDRYAVRLTLESAFSLGRARRAALGLGKETA